MRPIDADEVKLPKGFFENVTTVPRFYGWLDTIPTIDAVPVVRCKDCKWWKTNYSWNGKEHKVCVIEPYEPVRKPDDYCSMGERRDNVTND